MKNQIDSCIDVFTRQVKPNLPHKNKIEQEGSNTKNWNKASENIVHNPYKRKYNDQQLSQTRS